MPPVFSEVESDTDVPEMIPAKAPKPASEAADENADEEDEEVAEDEYQVEEVLGHKTVKGQILYQIKWLGYDNDEDLTWEPVENLETAPDALAAYHTKIGSVPDAGKGSSKKPKGRVADKRRSEAAESPAPSKKARGRRDTNGDPDTFVPPIGTWENDVTRVAAILEGEEVTEGQKSAKDIKSLLGLLEWKNGRKTQHKMSLLRTKCPQRLLDYYENHLVFRGDPRYVDDETS